jgi:hypothetical protein
MQPKGIVDTLPAFAAELGMTRDVLRRIVSEGGVRPAGGSAKRPTYRLADIYRAIQAQGDGAESNPHSRLARAKAVKVELEIAVRRGELLDSTDVERSMGLLAAFVARAFDVAVDSLERDVGLSAQQAAYLERYFDQQRELLARQWEGDERQPKANGHDEAHEARV